MLSGENSILSQARRARDITGEKTIEEKVQLAYMAALSNGNGEVTRQLLEAELDKEFGENGYNKPLSDLTKVTIDEKDYNFDGTVTPGDGEGGGGSGLVEQEDGTFKDGKGNEWVWIEVPKSVTASATTDDDIYNALRGYCDPVISIGTSSSNNKTTTAGYTDEWYAWDTTIDEAITEETENLTDAQKALTNGCGLSLSEYNITKSAMLNSIKDNGGFYIGKYETGNEGGTLNKTYYDADDNVVENPASTLDYDYYWGAWNGGKAVIKQNQFPYNWVTCSQAQNIAKGFATEGKTASLLFGIQWDLVLKFLSVKGEATNLLNDNSTSWGNYYNNTYNITNTEAWYSTDYGANWTKGAYSKTTGGEILLTTGAHSSFSKQNIFDFAGNVYEWTLERTSDYDYPCTSRGGTYYRNGDYSPVSNRLYHDAPYFNDFVGFRVALY